MPLPPPCARSVAHIDTEDVLRRALLTSLNVSERLDWSTSRNSHNNKRSNSSEEGGVEKNSENNSDCDLSAAEDILSIHGACQLDWVLADADPEASQVQNLEQELRRLAVLKSYNLLETERSRCFDRYTEMAARLCECPVSMISLIDIGRAWLLSAVGVDERIREGPRKLAFCAHTILSNTGTMVINDSRLDSRFQDSPYVTAPDGAVHFYAGVSLMCPEGYRLGTICVVDSKPRPDGMSESQLRNLKDLAEMIVEVMVAHKVALEHERALVAPQSIEESIACASHDLFTPLSGALMSLSLLEEDADFQSRLDPQQRDLLATAATCTNFVVRLCESSIDGMRGKSCSGKAASPCLSTRADTGDSGDGSAASQMLVSADNRLPDKVMKMDDLLRSLRTVLEPIHKRVPIVVRLERGTPRTFPCDELKLFRSALNLLSSAVARTRSGYVCLTIRLLRQSCDLVFECEDTGPPVPEPQQPLLYGPCSRDDGDLRLSLFSVARTIWSLGGVCGFYPRQGEYDDKSSAPGTRSRSVFWFKVPTSSQASDRPTLSGAMRLRDPVIGAPPDGNVSSVATGVMAAPSSPPSESSAFGTSRAACFDAPFDTAVASPQDVWKRSAPAGSETLSASIAHSDESLRAAPFSSLVSEHNYGPSRNTVAPGVQLSSPRSPQRRRPLRALVIDDSLVIRKSVSMALRKFGFEVSTAVDGLEGLNAMKRAAFDLVLCDFLMPVMDGLDCVKQYREWEAADDGGPLSELKHRPGGYRQLIVGMSAHGGGQAEIQGRSAGMDGFLSKPIGVPILKDLIKSERVHGMSQLLDSIEGTQDSHQMYVSDSDVVENGDHCAVKPFSPPAELMPCANLRETEIRDPLKTQPLKRPRDDNSNSKSEPNCLLATNQPEHWICAATAGVESYGWKVTVVHDSALILGMLQSRNWEAVLIEGDLGGLDAEPKESCVTQFRSWERQNRINLQKNVCWLTELDVPSCPDPESCIVLAPQGYDRVLRKPVRWDDLKLILDSHGTGSTLTIIVNN
jgi:CheY-like chemotaxis protein